MSSIKSNNLELSNSLNSQLLIYIRAVFTEQIAYFGHAYRIGYGPDWRDESELHPSIMEKFGIGIYFVDRQRSDYPIMVLCVLKDKLGDIFKKYHFAPFLNITLQNSEDDFIEFRQKDDMKFIVSCTPLSSTLKNAEEYANFLEAVRKELLFTTIKYS